MTSLRIALLVNPFTLRRVGRDHAPSLARELLGRGHVVRGFGTLPGVIPRSSVEPEVLEVGGSAAQDLPGLRGFAPDVIVAYDVLSPAAWLGARRARKQHVPLVLVEQGLPAFGRPLERIVRRIGEWLWGPYVRRTAVRIVAVDAWVREQVRREGFRDMDVVTLGSGLDLTVFRPGLTSPLPGRHGVRGRMLLHVGQIEEGRGLDTLIRAFARTVGQRGDWTLVLAGDGPAGRSLRVLADRLGVGASLRWLTRPRDEELPGLLGSATLFAAPTLAEADGTLKIRRALACGLPVLASDLARTRELVEPDGCGLLVEPGDVEAWTQAIRQAASSPERRKRWSARARQLASERMSWPVIAERYEAVLLKAVEEERVVPAPSPEGATR